MIYDDSGDFFVPKHPSLGPTSAGIPIPTLASVRRQSHRIPNTFAAEHGVQNHNTSTQRCLSEEKIPRRRWARPVYCFCMFLGVNGSYVLRLPQVFVS